ncbi:MAG TPA: hypothetical protein VMT55_05880 [Candidatus Sulfotelmatobacter sp.]|nr:hypothetical protein [Candidatus Sulfotelmatobacter sp.]
MKNRHFIEAVFSLFLVGAGQLIKGEGTKGLLFLLGFYFALPAAAYAALLLNPYLFLFVLGLAIIAGIVTWLYNVFDAFTFTDETII